MKDKDSSRLDLYLQDAAEHLAAVERALLNVEVVEPHEVELLNDLFRAVHTIKGGASFLGLDAISNLAHAIEDTFDVVRNGTRALGRDEIDLMIEAVDQLKTLVANPSADVPTSDIVARLRQLDNEEENDGFSVERAQLEAWQAEGFRLYVIDAEDPDDLRANIDDIGYEVERAGHQILFRSVLDLPLAREYLEVAAENLYPLPESIDDDNNSVEGDPLGDEAPARSASKEAEAGVKAMPVRQTESPQTSSIRVNVSLLDSLMNLAGELVLTRNQLNQGVMNGDEATVGLVAQRLDTVTSELQEAIMSTRMQPISVVLNQYQRLTRDMSRRLGKSVQLVTHGEDVELDKSIIENIGDPLTHLVRNAIDHGVETDVERAKTGKPATATLTISTRHEGGHVVIDVADDGKGLDITKILSKAVERGFVERAGADQMSEREISRLIFLPGFSTAAEVTDVSGRGVGMDVVYTNLQKLGGTIDVESRPGRGTLFRIKLPLTLTIVPSLLVRVRGETFAIPQVNLVELVRLSDTSDERIEMVGDTALLRRRGQLLPVVWLDRLMQMSADSSSASGPVNVVVVASGDFHYGIVVDELTDSEEIVVKPLGAHLRGAREYAGATILGDGRAALILDVTGISEVALVSGNRDADSAPVAGAAVSHLDAGDEEKLLVVENAKDEYFGVQLAYVNRIERVPATSLQRVGNKTVVKYRGGVLQVFMPEDGIDANPRTETSYVFLIIYHMMGREVAFAASNIIDIVDAPEQIDHETFRQTAVGGSTIIMDRICLLLDVFGLAKAIDGSLEEDRIGYRGPVEKPRQTVLVVEDSIFFQDKLKELMEEMDLGVKVAADGEEGWQILDANAAKIDVVLMDVEMPRLNGLELTQRVRSDRRFNRLPIVMLTSLAKDSDIEKGRVAGANDYLVKMDPEMVKQSVRRHLDMPLRQRSAA